MSVGHGEPTASYLTKECGFVGVRTGNYMIEIPEDRK
jgi:hypothetical protein